LKCQFYTSNKNEFASSYGSKNGRTIITGEKRSAGKKFVKKSFKKMSYPLIG